MISNATLNSQYFLLKDSIEHVIEFVLKNFEKIKSSLKNENNNEYLESINSNLQKISKILWDNHLLFDEEIKCFSQIEHYIIYIVSKNCENNDFGHISCTIYLLDIFKKLIDAKFEYLSDESKQDHYNNICLQYPRS